MWRHMVQRMAFYESHFLHRVALSGVTYSLAIFRTPLCWSQLRLHSAMLDARCSMLDAPVAGSFDVNRQGALSSTSFLWECRSQRSASLRDIVGDRERSSPNLHTSWAPRRCRGGKRDTCYFVSKPAICKCISTGARTCSFTEGCSMRFYVPGSAR